MQIAQTCCVLLLQQQKKAKERLQLDNSISTDYR
jgi:hypothetical protein